MKKVMNQKVKLSKTAKKVLAGVLAASMVFSGTMTSFVTTSETVNAEEAAVEATSAAIGLEIVNDNKAQNNAEIGIVEDRMTAVKFGEAGSNPVGIEVKNPFAGKTELSESLIDAVSATGVTFYGLTREYNGNPFYIDSQFKEFKSFNENNPAKIQVLDHSGTSTFDKAKIQEVYETARKNMLSDEAIAQAKDLLAKAASGDVVFESTAKTVAETIVAASGNDASLAAADVVYHYNGSNRGAVNHGDPSAVSGEFTYPYPTWTKGVTISTWVKVPKDAQWSAPIFTFQDVTTEACTEANNPVKTCPDGLTLRTDGQFLYAASMQEKPNTITNYYNSEFQGETPFANKGEWVYVTMTIMNDGVEVYYNGKKATEVVSYNQSMQGKAKDFNGGFGLKAFGTDYESRLQALANAQGYPQILANCETEDDWNDYSKYTFKSARLMMDLVTDNNTKFFLGGDDGKNGTLYLNKKIYTYTGSVLSNSDVLDYSKKGSKVDKDPDKTQPYWGRFSKWSEGMELDDMTTADYVMTPEQVEEAYAAAKEVVKDEWIQVIQNENAQLSADKAAAKAAIEAQKVAEATKLAEAEVQIEKDLKAVTVTAVEVTGSSATIDEAGVITFDRLFGVTGDSVGVLVENPFSGKYELAETLADALSGNAISALASYIEYKGTGLHMHSKVAEFKGFKLSDIKVDSKDASGNAIKVLVGQKVQLNVSETDAILDKQTILDAFDESKAAMLAATADAVKHSKLVEVSPEWYKWDSDQTKKIADKIIAQDIDDEDVIYTWDGARNGYENPDPYSVDEIKYSLPTWDEGVTISTWVKVKKDTPWSAPIFSFGNGRDGMTLRTDGSFIFAGDIEKDQPNKRLYNNYVAKFSGYTPYDNQDTWVYVTLTVKNDEIHVYYNGEEAKQTIFKDVCNLGKNGSKNFNGGFGFKAYGNDSKIIKKLVEDGRYPQLLQNFKSGDTDFSNTDNYSYSTYTLMMDLIVNPATELYLGGDNGTALATDPGKWILRDGNGAYGDPINGWQCEWARCNMYSSGLKIANFSTLDYVVDATEAKALFNIQDSRDYIKTENDYSELKTSKHINKMYEEENNSKTETVNIKGTDTKVITLGRINTDEVDYAKGVELVNPFKGNTDLVEDFTTGLTNSGKTFKGLTYTITKDIYGDIDGDGQNESTPIDQETYLQVATNMNTFGGFRFTHKYVVNWIDLKEKDAGEFWADNDPNYKKDALVVDGDGLKRYSLQDKAAFVTKADALYAYNTARNFLIDNNYIGANGQAAEWLKKTTAAQNALVTPYAVKLASIEKAEDLTPAAVHYTYNGPARLPEGNLTDITTIKDEFSYPMPKWTKGVTISTWVKVPETAAFSTPIYTFANSGGLDGLTLRTDGTLMYLADGAGSGEEENYFVANYAGDTPFDNKGEWVYVTLTIKNDEFKVYYNGVKADEKISSQFAGAGKDAGAGFNYGFAYSNTEDRLKNMLLSDANPYVDMLKNFEVGTTDFSDVTKYNQVYDNTSVMEFITKSSTKLYVGGYCKSIYSDNGKIYDTNKTVTDPATGKNIAWGGYSDYAEGMQVGGFAFETKVVTDSEARMLYNDTFLVDETDVPYPTIEPSEDPTPTDGTDAPAPTASAGTSETDAPAPTASAGTGETDAPAPTASAGTGETDAPAPTAGTTSAPVNPSESAPASETPVVSTTPSETPVNLGDASGNGVVELDDAQLTLKIALLIIKDATPAQIKACDIDGNGSVDLADAQAILKEALKITENFKPKK